jgi:hypothetical protein
MTKVALVALVALLSTLSSIPSASAATAYTYAGPIAGNQTFIGSLGLDFNVVSAIEITSLLAFDDDADGWTTGSAVGVTIYDRDTGTALIPYVSFSPSNPGTLVGGSYRSLTLATPITLSAGGHYSVVAQSFNANDRLRNSGVAGGTPPTTDDGGGLITFTGTGRNGNPLNQFPVVIDLGPTNRYGAGSFEFQAIPEPGSFTLAASVGLLASVRRRRA